jgi:hypothetical protein
MKLGTLTKPSRGSWSVGGIERDALFSGESRNRSGHFCEQRVLVGGSLKRGIQRAVVRQESGE